MKPLVSTAPADPATLAGLGPAPQAYIALQEQLGKTGWVCQGTVVARPLRRQVQGRSVETGPYYLWTCKVKGRTVCVALSKAQYQVLAEAIENHRRFQKILERMQALTLKTVLKKVQGVKRRKRP